MVQMAHFLRMGGSGSSRERGERASDKTSTNSPEAASGTEASLNDRVGKHRVRPRGGRREGQDGGMGQKFGIEASYRTWR